MPQNKNKFIALLRGINVGGHKKVPMATLKSLLESMNFSSVKTLLNSGNVVFESSETSPDDLADKLSAAIESIFGFPVPVIVRTTDDIRSIIDLNPFAHIEVHKDIRLYVTFMGNQSLAAKSPDPAFPWLSPEGSFSIIGKKAGAVFSVLDVSKSKTPDAMIILEKFYTKDITTRNWNTVEKIGKVMG